MRPINLIPKEERRDAGGPMRGGPLAYIVIGALVAALVAITVLVVTNSQISTSKSEITTLNAEISEAQARAAESAAYTQFHLTSEQRATTVSNLANSRFDWERVMRQLSLVMPSDVWLTNLTATVKPGVSVNGGASIALRESIAGPALQIEGCATGQESVARFLSALREIEGVTRVGIQSSTLPDSSEGGSVSASGTCQTRKFIAQFQIVVAFDAAPIPSTGSGSGEAEAVPAPEATEAPASPETETTSETEGG